MTVIETPNETAAALTTWDCCVRVVLLARLTEGVEWNTSGLQSNMLVARLLDGGSSSALQNQDQICTTENTKHRLPQLRNLKGVKGPW